jgi:hypothetical protein
LGGFDPFLGGFATPFLSVFGGFLSGVFAPVFDGHFHGSFSVGHCSGNCLFHWVLCDFGPFFECFVNSGLEWPFV